jgi:hypothetical protein
MVAMNGGATIRPAAVTSAAKTKTGVTSGSLPSTATAKRMTSMASRSQNVPVAARMTRDTIRITMELRGETNVSSTPATRSGNVHRYAAAGANHETASASTIQTGSA